MSGLLRHAQTHIFGRLLREDGTPNIPVIEKYALAPTSSISCFHKRESFKTEISPKQNKKLQAVS
jgi:hypothetical protein